MNKKVLLDIVTACNAKCKYCLHQYKNLIKPQFIKEETFDAISEILVRENYNYVFLYMSGEPLLHPMIWNMISKMSNIGICTDVASKIYCNIEFSDMIKCFKSLKEPLNFCFTIDAHCQDLQNKIAKNINLDLVFNNLKIIKEASNGNNVNVIVTTVVNDFNEKYLLEIRNRVSNYGIKWISKSMGYYMGYKIDDEDEKMITQMIAKGNDRFSVINGKIISKMKKCKFIKPAIGVTGDVTICCHDMLWHESEWNVIETNSLDSIVSSPKYIEKVNKAKNMNLKICNNCN